MAQTLRHQTVAPKDIHGRIAIELLLMNALACPEVRLTAAHLEAVAMADISRFHLADTPDGVAIGCYASMRSKQR